MSDIYIEDLRKEYENIYDGIMAGEYGGERTTAIDIMVNIAEEYSQLKIMLLLEKIINDCELSNAEPTLEEIRSIQKELIHDEFLKTIREKK